MRVEQNYDLIRLNTFSVAVNAKFFVVMKNEQDFKELFTLPQFKNNDKLFLGGGSNILFTKDFAGIVVLNKLKGIKVLAEDSQSVLIRSMGGEVWHDLVTFAVSHDYWGIENLAYIPGTVGAAPMQNIGAYGAELQNVLESVEAVEVATGERKIFKIEECCFGYRDSIFKQALKGKYFILAITLKLSKKEKKNISYKVLKDYLEENKIEVTSPRDISDAVTVIRKSKLPDPKVIPNAGSFFKNVFIKKEELEKMLQTYPEMLYFFEGKKVKIPAAWLIEQCGWKGKRVGNVGVHEKQALVLVNHGGASGEEIKKLAGEIINSVHEKFGLKLTPEVNLI